MATGSLLSPTEDRPRRCLFCGGTTTLSAEHVMPKWVQTVLGTAPGTYISMVSGVPHTVRSWRGTGFSHTIRTVCRPCNNGWLARLEARAKVVLTPPILGQPSNLGPAEQETTSVWAVKTAAVIAHVQRGVGTRAFIPAVTGGLYRDCAVPPGAKVFLAACVPTEVVDRRDGYDTARARISPLHHIPPDDHLGYFAVLTVGALVLVVIGQNADVPPRMDYGSEPEAVVQIWPSMRTTVAFPPAARLSADQINGLSWMVERWTVPPE